MVINCLTISNQEYFKTKLNTSFLNWCILSTSHIWRNACWNHSLVLQMWFLKSKPSTILLELSWIRMVPVLIPLKKTREEAAELLRTKRTKPWNILPKWLWWWKSLSWQDFSIQETCLFWWKQELEVRILYATMCVPCMKQALWSIQKQ